MEDVERAFAVFDKEGKGHIPTAELKHMMTKIGAPAEGPGRPALASHAAVIPHALPLCPHSGEALTEEEVDEMVRNLDADNSGTIDVHEFASMM